MFPTRILIIAHGAVQAESLKTVLGRRATDVRIARDAETAMEIFQSFAPDLMVLDYNLPGIERKHVGGLPNMLIADKRSTIWRAALRMSTRSELFRLELNASPSTRIVM